MTNWLILALILFLIDMITATALVIGFSISALITAVISIFLPFLFQLICFFIIGVILTITFVPKLRKIPKVQSYIDSLEGCQIKASCDMVANELYQEQVKGVFWNIKCTTDVKKHQIITIIKIDKESNCLIMKGE